MGGYTQTTIRDASGNIVGYQPVTQQNPYYAQGVSTANSQQFANYNAILNQYQYQHNAIVGSSGTLYPIPTASGTQYGTYGMGSDGRVVATPFQPTATAVDPGLPQITGRAGELAAAYNPPQRSVYYKPESQLQKEYATDVLLKQGYQPSVVKPMVDKAYGADYTNPYAQYYEGVRSRERAAAAPEVNTLPSSFYMAEGLSNRELLNTKVAVDPLGGSFGVYQQRPARPGFTPHYGFQTAGGSQGAAQSGQFGFAPTSPFITNQWNNELSPRADAAKTAAIRANPQGFSRPGAEAYGGDVQPLDGRTLAAGAAMGRYPNNPWNLANFVDPKGSNLPKDQMANEQIPWQMNNFETAPTLQGVNRNSVFSPIAMPATPSQVEMREKERSAVESLIGTSKPFVSKGSSGSSLQSNLLLNNVGSNPDPNHEFLLPEDVPLVTPPQSPTPTSPIQNPNYGLLLPEDVPSPTITSPTLPQPTYNLPSRSGGTGLPTGVSFTGDIFVSDKSAKSVPFENLLAGVPGTTVIPARTDAVNTRDVPVMGDILAFPAMLTMPFDIMRGAITGEASKPAGDLNFDIPILSRGDPTGGFRDSLIDRYPSQMAAIGQTVKSNPNGTWGDFFNKPTIIESSGKVVGERLGSKEYISLEYSIGKQKERLSEQEGRLDAITRGKISNGVFTGTQSEFDAYQYEYNTYKSGYDLFQSDVKRFNALPDSSKPQILYEAPTVRAGQSGLDRFYNSNRDQTDTSIGSLGGMSGEQFRANRIGAQNALMEYAKEQPIVYPLAGAVIAGNTILNNPTQTAISVAEMTAGMYVFGGVEIAGGALLRASPMLQQSRYAVPLVSAAWKVVPPVLIGAHVAAKSTDNFSDFSAPGLVQRGSETFADTIVPLAAGAGIYQGLGGWDAIRGRSPAGTTTGGGNRGGGGGGQNDPNWNPLADMNPSVPGVSPIGRGFPMSARDYSLTSRFAEGEMTPSHFNRVMGFGGGDTTLGRIENGRWVQTTGGVAGTNRGSGSPSQIRLLGSGSEPVTPPSVARSVITLPSSQSSAAGVGLLPMPGGQLGLRPGATYGGSESAIGIPRVADWFGTGSSAQAPRVKGVAAQQGITLQSPLQFQTTQATLPTYFGGEVQPFAPARITSGAPRRVIGSVGDILPASSASPVIMGNTYFSGLVDSNARSPTEGLVIGKINKKTNTGETLGAVIGSSTSTAFPTRLLNNMVSGGRSNMQEGDSIVAVHFHGGVGTSNPAQVGFSPMDFENLGKLKGVDELYVVTEHELYAIKPKGGQFKGITEGESESVRLDVLSRYFGEGIPINQKSGETRADAYGRVIVAENNILAMEQFGGDSEFTIMEHGVVGKPTTPRYIPAMYGEGISSHPMANPLSSFFPEGALDLQKQIPQESLVTLYRGEEGAKPQILPDWLAGSSDAAKIKNVGGRWFTESLSDARDYAADADMPIVKSLSVPKSIADTYRVSNLELNKGLVGSGETPWLYSAQGMSGKEIFLPRSIADGATRLEKKVPKEPKVREQQSFFVIESPEKGATIAKKVGGEFKYSNMRGVAPSELYILKTKNLEGGKVESFGMITRERYNANPANERLYNSMLEERFAIDWTPPRGTTEDGVRGSMYARHALDDRMFHPDQVSLHILRTQSGELGGMMSLNERLSSIDHLSSRVGGGGTALMTIAETRFRERGFRQYEVQSWSGSVPFYEKMGMQQKGGNNILIKNINPEGGYSPMLQKQIPKESESGKVYVGKEFVISDGITWNTARSDFNEVMYWNDAKFAPSQKENLAVLRWMKPTAVQEKMYEIFDRRAAQREGFESKPPFVRGKESYENWLDQPNVEMLKERMQDKNNAFNALTLFYDRKGQIGEPQEGRHRTTAAIELGVKKIPVWEVFKQDINLAKTARIEYYITSPENKALINRMKIYQPGELPSLLEKQIPTEPKRVAGIERSTFDFLKEATSRKYGSKIERYARISDTGETLITGIGEEGAIPTSVFNPDVAAGTDVFAHTHPYLRGKDAPFNAQAHLPSSGDLYVAVKVGSPKEMIFSNKGVTTYTIPERLQFPKDASKLRLQQAEVDAQAVLGDTAFDLLIGLRGKRENSKNILAIREGTMQKMKEKYGIEYQFTPYDQLQKQIPKEPPTTGGITILKENYYGFSGVERFERFNPLQMKITTMTSGSVIENSPGIDFAQPLITSDMVQRSADLQSAKAKAIPKLITEMNDIVDWTVGGKRSKSFATDTKDMALASVEYWGRSPSADFAIIRRPVTGEYGGSAFYNLYKDEATVGNMAGLGKGAGNELATFIEKDVVSRGATQITLTPLDERAAAFWEQQQNYQPYGDYDMIKFVGSDAGRTWKPQPQEVKVVGDRSFINVLDLDTGKFRWEDKASRRTSGASGDDSIYLEKMIPKEAGDGRVSLQKFIPTEPKGSQSENYGSVSPYSNRLLGDVSRSKILNPGSKETAFVVNLQTGKLGAVVVGEKGRIYTQHIEDAIGGHMLQDVMDFAPLGIYHTHPAVSKFDMLKEAAGEFAHGVKTGIKHNAPISEAIEHGKWRASNYLTDAAKLDRIGYGYPSASDIFVSRKGGEEGLPTLNIQEEGVISRKGINIYRSDGKVNPLSETYTPEALELHTKNVRIRERDLIDSYNLQKQIPKEHTAIDIDVARSERAKQTYKPVTATKYQQSLASEQFIARMVGGRTTPKHHPVDILGVGDWAIEVKTVFPGAHEKMTMHGFEAKTGYNALEAKRLYVKGENKLWALPEDVDSLRGVSVMRVLATDKMYVKEGFGSYRSYAMKEVDSGQLVAFLRKDIPSEGIKSQRTFPRSFYEGVPSTALTVVKPESTISEKVYDISRTNAVLSGKEGKIDLTVNRDIITPTRTGGSNIIQRSESYVLDTDLIGTATGVDLIPTGGNAAIGSMDIFTRRVETDVYPSGITYEHTIGQQATIDVPGSSRAGVLSSRGISHGQGIDALKTMEHADNAFKIALPSGEKVGEVSGGKIFEPLSYDVKKAIGSKLSDKSTVFKTTTVGKKFEGMSLYVGKGKTRSPLSPVDIPPSAMDVSVTTGIMEMEPGIIPTETLGMGRGVVGTGRVVRGDMTSESVAPTKQIVAAVTKRGKPVEGGGIQGKTVEDILGEHAIRNAPPKSKLGVLLPGSGKPSTSFKTLSEFGIEVTEKYSWGNTVHPAPERYAGNVDPTPKITDMLFGDKAARFETEAGRLREGIGTQKVILPKGRMAGGESIQGDLLSTKRTKGDSSAVGGTKGNAALKSEVSSAKSEAKASAIGGIVEDLFKKAAAGVKQSAESSKAASSKKTKEPVIASIISESPSRTRDTSSAYASGFAGGVYSNKRTFGGLTRIVNFEEEEVIYRDNIPGMKRPRPHTQLTEIGESSIAGVAATSMEEEQRRKRGIMPWQNEAARVSTKTSFISEVGKIAGSAAGLASMSGIAAAFSIQEPRTMFKVGIQQAQKTGTEQERVQDVVPFISQQPYQTPYQTPKTEPIQNPWESPIGRPSIRPIIPPIPPIVPPFGFPGFGGGSDPGAPMRGHARRAHREIIPIVSEFAFTRKVGGHKKRRR